MESERCSEIFQIRIVNSRAGSGPGVISTPKPRIGSFDRSDSFQTIQNNSVRPIWT